MTDNMNVPMFEPPPRTRPKPRGLAACNAATTQGNWSAWVLRDRPALSIRIPVYNRVPGHDGPHRYYDRKARVCAEW